MTIANQQLKNIWFKIARHLNKKGDYAQEYSGILCVNTSSGPIYLAKNSNKFRLKSHLDWAYYTPKTLADAINNLQVDAYYEIMLNNQQSDPNLWKDQLFEMTLKSYYAERNNRASLI